jgi:ABC-type glycerol-3-phosphate transport system permease component
MATLQLLPNQRTQYQQPLHELFLKASLRFLLHAVLLGIGFIYIFPFLWMVGSSLKTSGDFFNQGLAVLPAGEWQWQNFSTAWQTAKFGQYFLNTVFITVMTMISTLILSSMAAFALSRLKVRGKGLILGAVAVVWFLPKGYTILPVFEIVRGLGLLNTLWAIVLVNTAGGLMFCTFLFYGYLRTIPHEIEEAAVIDGASVPQRYWRVVMPLASPMIATLALFLFMWNWNDFFTSLVFTLGKPELRTLAVGMYAFVGQNSRDWTLMCAGATISLLPIIIVYVALQRYFVEGLAGAVKA